MTEIVYMSSNGMDVHQMFSLIAVQLHETVAVPRFDNETPHAKQQR
jgi:hypothetical protein